MSESRYRVFRARPGEWIVENTRTKAQYTRSRWQTAVDLADAMARVAVGFRASPEAFKRG